MLTTNENPVYLDTRLDWRVLAFVAALGCLTTVLFGLAPAIRASAALAGRSRGARRQKPDGPRRHGAVAGRGADRFQPDDPVRCGSSAALVRPAARASISASRPDGVALLSVEARDRLEPAQAREVGASAARARSGLARRRERQPLWVGALQGLVVGQQHRASRAAAVRRRSGSRSHRSSSRRWERGSSMAASSSRPTPMRPNPMAVDRERSLRPKVLPGRARGRPAHDHDEPWPERCRTKSSALRPTSAMARCAER